MEPFRSWDGHVIVGMLCSCGHPQERHGHRLAELPDTLVGVPGHGPCLEGECPCKRFGFKEYI